MFQNRNRSHRKLALFATASLLTMLTATPALADCDPTPVTEPIGNITADGTVVSCTGANTAKTVVSNAGFVEVHVQPGATLDNSSVTMNGDLNSLNLAGGSTSSNLDFVSTGLNGQIIFASGSSATNLSASLTGDNSYIRILAGATVTSAPGSIVMSNAPGEYSTLSLLGTLSASGNNGGAYLLTGGSSTQTYNIHGTLNAAPNGLLINAGGGDDSIYLVAGAVIGGGTGNNLLFDGGSGDDRLTIEGGGTNNYSSANIEQLFVAPGIGNIFVLTGTGDYSTVNFYPGTTSVADLASLGQSNSTVGIGFGGRLLLNLGGSASFDHALTGGGTIEQDGQTITYTANGSSFSGTFRITSGTATIASSSAFGTAAIDNNSALELTAITLGNTISGTGTVTKVGGSIGVLSGTNSYTGGTFVQGGTLSITNSGAVSTGLVTVGPGTTFDLNFATDQTFSNDITGPGSVSKNGAGIATLTGTNDYSGGTVINAGGIRVDDLARLGTGPVTANTNAFLILDYNGAAPLVLSNPFLSGDGGFVKEGTGELELGGINGWTGGTAIRAGTLRMASADALGTGQIRVDAGAVLALGNTFSSPSVSNNISGAGTILIDTPGGAALYGDNSGFSGTINLASINGYLYAQTSNALGTGTVNLGNSSTLLEFDNPFNEILSTTLTGSGTFEKRGSGVLELTGINSLTGNVDVRSGTLRVGSGANIGTAAVNLDSGAFLNIETSSTVSFANTITGQGRLQKNGAGTVLVTGTNSYSGGTDIFGGAIRVTDVAALGTGPISVSSGAFLDLSIAGSATLNVTASGAGKLRKSDIGDLTLTSNALTGGVDIVGGRVIVHDVSSLGSGPVTTAADTQIVFDLSGPPHVSSVSISGAGALTKNGSGLLVIQNANSFTGGTVINAGRIGLNDGGALGSGAILVQLGAILGIGDINLANSVTGGGQIIKTAGGNAVLTGTNTHSGGIDIQGGSVSVTGNASLGTGTVTIGSGTQLNYTATGNLTFANALAGSGNFNKLGTGMLTFANPFSIGSLTVATGRVRINTVATTNATVASGATLDGTGRIVGNLTNNGVVAPGNSIGTLTVQGNYVHGSGSVLEIEFDGVGGIDLLSVTGSATLNGGTLRFISIGGAEGSGGTFLTATGGVTGTFATVETVGAQLPLAVIYQTNSAIMAPSVLTARPSTFNAQSFAAADTLLGFVDTIAEAPRSGEGSRLWLQGFGADGNRSASGTTLSYGHRSHGLSGGLIVPIGNGWSAGLSGGWAKGDIVLGANGGGGDQDSLLGALQIQYAGSGASFSAGFVAGKVDQDTLRNVSFNSFSASVTGETKSSLIGGYVAADVRLGGAGGWDFGVSGRASLVRQSQDGYTESGSSPLRLTVGDIETTTIEGRAGLSAKRSFAGGLSFRVDAGARYLGATGDRRIPVTFAASNAGIVLQGDTRDGVQGYGAARLDWRVSDRVTLGIGYSGQVGQTDRHEGRAGLSIGF